MISSNRNVKCLRCGYVRNIGNCDNCGNSAFKRDVFDNLECTRCGKSYSHWTCPNCNTQNLFGRTIQLNAGNIAGGLVGGILVIIIATIADQNMHSCLSVVADPAGIFLMILGVYMYFKS